MIRKKNGFWTFIFSLFPGAGEMYLGFMKMGTFLMGLFLLIFVVGATFSLGPVLCLAVIVWFYSFFHVHNLAGMPDEEFYAMEDEIPLHLFEDAKSGEKFVRKYRKIIAVVLILLGIDMLWNSIFYGGLMDFIPSAYFRIIDTILYIIPRCAIAIVIIGLGIYLIKGKKAALEQDVEKQAAQKQTVQEQAAQEQDVEKQ